MRSLTRVVSFAAAATLAATVVGAAPASASTVGVGTTTTKTSVLTLQIGNLLDLGLLTDTGATNIDPHAGALRATTSLVPITLASPALHLDLSTPALTTLQPGGSPSVAGPSLSLAGLGVPAAVATGTIKPANLASSFASGAAHAAMTAAEVDNLTVAGGALASIDLLSSNLGADAVTAQADGLRGVKIGTIKLLDLGALLKGVGVDLAALPVGALGTLAKQLNLPIPNLTGSSDLATEVSSLTDAIGSLQNSLVNATTTISTPVDQLTTGLLPKLNLPAVSVGTAVSQVNAELSSLESTLKGLLTTALSALDSAPLIQVSGTQLGINTTAADTVGDSVAGVTIAPLSITVAGVTLPTINPADVTNAVNAAVSQANSALNGLLGTLGLPTNLVSLSLLDQARNVAQHGDYTEATAGVTMLTAKVAPVDLSAITGAIAKLTGTTATSLLGSTPLGGVLPSSTAMSTLNGLLGQAAPLLNGVQLQVASLNGASTYTFSPVPAATPTPAVPARIPTNLPHPGGDPALAIIGTVLAALALGLIRWVRVSRAEG